MASKQQYTSPIKDFIQKANQLCEKFRKAKGFNQKLSTCNSCKLAKCIVPEGTFTPEELIVNTVQYNSLPKILNPSEVQ